MRMKILPYVARVHLVAHYSIGKATLPVANRSLLDDTGFWADISCVASI